MTRKDAVIFSRLLFGEMGTIVSYDDIDGVPTPKAVWRIGEMDKTIGRGKTWEDAFIAALRKLTRLPQKTEADVAEHNRLHAVLDGMLLLKREAVL